MVHVKQKGCLGLVVVAAQALFNLSEFNLSDLSEFEARLVYRVSSRTARVTQRRNPALKNQPTNEPNKQTNQKVMICVKKILAKHK